MQVSASRRDAQPSVCPFWSLANARFRPAWCAWGPSVIHPGMICILVDLGYLRCLNHSDSRNCFCHFHFVLFFELSKVERPHKLWFRAVWWKQTKSPWCIAASTKTFTGAYRHLLWKIMLTTTHVSIHVEVLASNLIPDLHIALEEND